MSSLRLRAHLHFAAAVIIVAFRAAVAFRPASGCTTATVNAGNETPCAEARIA